MTDRARAERRLAYLLCAPAVLAMLLVTGYPIGYAIYLSLQQVDLRFPDEREFVGLVELRRGPHARPVVGRTCSNTVIITVASVAIELVLGMVLALVMHRAIFGRGAVRASVLIPYGIVTVVAAFAWRYAFTPDLGFVNGLFGFDRALLTDRAGAFLVVILAEVWKTTPFMALLLLAGLALVPDELHEAAKRGRGERRPALLPHHAAADEAGDPRGAPLPHARRVPRVRHASSS